MYITHSLKKNLAILYIDHSSLCPFFLNLNISFENISCQDLTTHFIFKKCFTVFHSVGILTLISLFLSWCSFKHASLDTRENASEEYIHRSRIPELKGKSILSFDRCRPAQRLPVELRWIAGVTSAQGPLSRSSGPLPTGSPPGAAPVAMARISPRTEHCVSMGRMREMRGGDTVPAFPEKEATFKAVKSFTRDNTDSI